LIPWPDEHLRRASINNFGYGGANAHAIIDDALHFLTERGLFGNHLTEHRSAVDSTEQLCQSTIQHMSPRFDRSIEQHLLLLSAADEKGVARQIQSFAQYMESKPNTLTDPAFMYRLAHTLSERRSKLRWRSFAVVQGLDLATETLSTKFSSPVRALSSPDIVFVFSGQGTSWPKMGRELLLYPVYRQSVEEADKHLSSLGCSWSVLCKRSSPHLLNKY
jgi:acyl transferase domain-containing protein